MKNNYSICLIVCWFGKFPQYFPLWELSASYNDDIQFLIFTDQDIISKYKNIKFNKMNIADFNKLASKKLKLDISIKKPYKLCDFKVSYGKIFEDYLKGYSFFGYCDIDLVFGNIRKYITNDILDRFDKINNLGHLTLYRNNKQMMELFKEKGSIYDYKTVFTTDENYAFDEYSGMHLIVKENKINEYVINNYADMSPKNKEFIICNSKNYSDQYFMFDNGKVFQVYNGGSNEYIYLHFQKKKPILSEFDDTIKKYYLSATSFSRKLSINEYNNLNKKLDEIKYYINKIKQFLKCSSEQKKIWINQKRVK